MVTVPGIEFLVRFAGEFFISPEWLLLGRGEPIPGGREKYPEVCGPDEYAATGDGVYSYVPQKSGDLCAGEGNYLYEQKEILIAFRHDWISRKGDPKKMSLVRVSGDSMEPTLYAGDLILVDHSRNHVDPQGGIYVISMNDLVMIKRIQVEGPDRFKIISDNPKYSPVDAGRETVKINGKVIWFGRELER